MGEVQTWSTDPLPTTTRFSAWSDKMQSLHLNWNLSTPAEESYSARIRYRSEPGIQIADCRCTAFSGRRDPSMGGADVVAVQLQLSGQMRCNYGRDAFTVSPGDIFVWAGDSARTFESIGDHRQLTFMVPRAQVPQTLEVWLERNHSTPAGPGAGLISIAADSIRSIGREMENLSNEEVRDATTNLLDLLGAATRPLPSTRPDRRATLVADIQAFVLRHLDDPNMSVHSIATARGVSTRTLHAAFADEDLTLSRWIRRQRLERCRRELVAAPSTTTVTDIAFRWGFNDAAHFSRSFKEAFGVPPSSVIPKAARPTWQ